MKANMGLLPEMERRIRHKVNRYAAYAERARTDMEDYLAALAFSL
jgi:folate-dependent tRNA-U54 methylase TrmFO/GidA